MNTNYCKFNLVVFLGIVAGGGSLRAVSDLGDLNSGFLRSGRTTINEESTNTDAHHGVEPKTKFWNNFRVKNLTFDFDAKHLILEQILSRSDQKNNSSTNSTKSS